MGGLGWAFSPLALNQLIDPLPLFIELCQHFSPGRTVDWRDMVANVCGLWMGFAWPMGWKKIATHTGLWPLLPAKTPNRHNLRAPPLSIPALA